jgi:hypothetical protein
MGTGVAPAVGAAPAAAVGLDPTFHYAVVVGIDGYPGLKSLRAARQDAKDFKKWLRESGVPEENIALVLTDESFSDSDKAIPTKQLVDIALRKIQADVVDRVKPDPLLLWPKTRLYLYLSGHGVTPNAREAMLLMANAQLGTFGDSVPCTKYMDFYEDVQFFHELVFFADCCRSIDMQTEPEGPPFKRVRQNRGRVTKFLGFAAGFGDLAWEPSEDEIQNPDDARGHFTRALLEGLRGQAVDRPTGQINSISLPKYVVQRVKKLTETKMPAPQEPQSIADPGFPIVFVEAVPRPMYRVTITFPAGFADDVTLRDAWGNDRDSHTASAAPWEVELADGLYEVVVANGTDFGANGGFRVRGGPTDVTL